MIDTRTCCVGDLPEGIAQLQKENYRVKRLNKILLITITSVVVFSITILLIDDIKENNLSNKINFS